MKARVAAYLKLLERVAEPPTLCEVCAEEGKTRRAWANGLCNKHNLRRLRYGDPRRKPESRSVDVERKKA